MTVLLTLEIAIGAYMYVTCCLKSDILEGGILGTVYWENYG